MNMVAMIDANVTADVSDSFMAFVSNDVTTAVGNDVTLTAVRNDVIALVHCAIKLRSGPLYVLSTISIQSQPTV